MCATLCVVAYPGGAPAPARRFVEVARALRVIEFVARIDTMHVTLRGLVRGVHATTSILLLLLLTLFIFGIGGRVMFGENDPGRFGSTPVAVLTLFQVAKPSRCRGPSGMKLSPPPSALPQVATLAD